MISHWLDYSALQQYNPIAMSGLCRRGALLKANNFTSNSSPNIIQNSSCEMLPPSEFTSPSLFSPFPLYFHLEDFYFLEFRWFSDSLKLFLPNCKWKLHLSSLHGVPTDANFIRGIVFFSQTISVILLNKFLWHPILFWN